MTAKQNPNVLATFAAILVAIFFAMATKMVTAGIAVV